MPEVGLVELTKEGLDGKGCFCLRSEPKSAGFAGKNKWLADRFEEGLKYIKMTEDGKAAGFIEYAPIQHSSRVVLGDDYLVIHCLWVQNTGKGYATQLIRECLRDAEEQGKAGVIVVANEETSWTPGKAVFLRNGFEKVGEAPHGFELLAFRIGEGSVPYFPNNWEERASSYRRLTIFTSPQCPFVEVAKANMLEAAGQLGLEADVVVLDDRDKLLALSPTPYGIYGVVYKGRLVAYHRLTVHSAKKRLKAML